MENYVYLKVKLVLKPGQTEESVQSIVAECDYEFTHEEIVEPEIIAIHDTQIGV